MADGPQRADDWRVRVWRSFLRAHTSVMGTLEHELDVVGLPLPWYDVLLQLVEAPDHRLRMAELADRVLLSRSGLTRLVDRLQDKGYVRRERSSDDARGTYSVLTRAGFDAFRAAAPVHLAGIREHVLSCYTDDELRTLGALLSRLGRDDTAAGDRAAGDRATGDRAAGDRAAGDRAAGDRATGDRAAGDPGAGPVPPRWTAAP